MPEIRNLSDPISASLASLPLIASAPRSSRGGCGRRIGCGLHTILHEVAPRVAGLQLLIVSLLFAGGPGRIVVPAARVGPRGRRGRRSIIGGGTECRTAARKCREHQGRKNCVESVAANHGRNLPLELVRRRITRG